MLQHKHTSPELFSVSVNNGHSHTIEYNIEPTPPDWQERRFVLKSSGNTIGLFKGPVDENTAIHFALYQPDQGECPIIPLEKTALDQIDWDTQIAFKTLPTLEVWQYTNTGILLQFPD